MTPISLTTTEEIDGDVRLNPTWAEMSYIARIDLLGDWIAVLQQLYALSHHDVYGSGYQYRSICVDAISGWEHHGKWPDHYRPALLKKGELGDIEVPAVNALQDEQP